MRWCQSLHLPATGDDDTLVNSKVLFDHGEITDERSTRLLTAN
jgi:hypothetical protein